MRIERIGYTAVKGGRHTSHDTVELTLAGPAGDRVFCLVDPLRARVLRTVQNPTLLLTESTWISGELSVDIAGRLLRGVGSATGERLKVDYWGRVVEVEVVDGPWAAAYSSHLGRDVVLARVDGPGDVVYGAPVSLVTTSSLAELQTRMGRRIDSARFRATFLVDTGAAAAGVEEGWVGHQVGLGDAGVLVRGVVPRCAVVDLDPDGGRADAAVLRALTGYRRGQDEAGFGVDAVVTVAGRVHTGDPVSPPAEGDPDAGRD